MAATVRFNGTPYTPADDPYGPSPYDFAFLPGDEKVFDAALAARYNRTCSLPGDDEARARCLREHDGACFAEMFVAAENAGFPKLSPPAFEIVTPTTPQTPQPTAPDAGQE